MARKAHNLSLCKFILDILKIYSFVIKGTLFVCHGNHKFNIRNTISEPKQIKDMKLMNQSKNDWFTNDRRNQHMKDWQYLRWFMQTRRSNVSKKTL